MPYGEHATLSSFFRIFLLFMRGSAQRPFKVQIINPPIAQIKEMRFAVAKLIYFSTNLHSHRSPTIPDGHMES